MLYAGGLFTVALNSRLDELTQARTITEQAELQQLLNGSSGENNKEHLARC